MYSFLRGLSATKFLVLVVLLAVSLPGSDSIKVLEIQVPPRVPTGETVRLGCLYDLEGANLYSLTWWRGTEQFYQFSPSSQEQMTVYDSPGITVDRKKSSRDEVVLRNVSHASAGRYKCEVLADFPSYEKDSQITSMEVIDMPASPPMVFIRRLQWSPGELLEANCTSPGARPPPQLHWYINEEKIPSQHSRMVTPEHKRHLDMGMGMGMGMGVGVGHPDPMDSLPRTSELKFQLRSAHFSLDGQATLTCVATLPGHYHRSADAHLSLPGFRAAAPSQKLYGGARQEGGAAPLLVLSVAALAFLAL